MNVKELWPGGPIYEGEAVGFDSLALAALAGQIPATAGCDLGCGSGILPLLLCRARPELTMTAVELRPEAAERCRANLDRNGLGARCRVITGDLRAVELPADSMDLVVSNPPYFPAGRGRPSPEGERALIRTETATVEELCARAGRLLRSGGSFCLVHRTARMPEVFAALQRSALEPKRLRLLSGGWDRAPELFLCQARKGAGPGLTLEPTLCQRGPDGLETAEYRQITHWEAM